VKRPITGTAVVVTGATSGVGRAVTLSLASRGAHVVAVARHDQSLHELLAACRALGTPCTPVVADVADSADVDRVVRTAVEAHGRIDTWINAASGLVIGRLEDQPVGDIERLVATNVLGMALTSRAALQQFERQDSGVLVNLSSLVGLVPNPLVPTYAMTKFAVRGLSMCLHEAARARAGIRVCTVLPGPVDTPMFADAANHSGRRARAVPPALSPERVAAVVIRSVERPRRYRTTGAIGVVVMAGLRVAPRTTETLAARWAGRMITSGDRATDTAGALHHPRRRASASGGFRRGRVRRSIGDAVGRSMSRR
jgi:short-subunit dehydrogenase